MQTFDPRAWLIFYACFMGTVLFFWDLRFLLVFDVIALSWVLTSGITWRETRRACLFIGGFIILFSVLTFLTGRGGMEVYETEHTLYVIQAPFSILGWTPTLEITIERLFFALSQWARVFALASMTVLIPHGLDPSKYGIAFRGLGLPDKFAYAMDLTMRFTPTFARDFQLTMDAQRARGYELEKNKGGGWWPRYAAWPPSWFLLPSMPSSAQRISLMQWSCVLSASSRAPGCSSSFTSPETES